MSSQLVTDCNCESVRALGPELGVSHDTSPSGMLVYVIRVRTRSGNEASVIFVCTMDMCIDAITGSSTSLIIHPLMTRHTFHNIPDRRIPVAVCDAVKYLQSVCNQFSIADIIIFRPFCQSSTF